MTPRSSVPRWDDPDPEDPTVPDVVYDPPRPPGAFVVSGPLTGPLNLTPAERRPRTVTRRGFRTVAAALDWCATKYRLVANVTPSGQRAIWAAIVVPR